MTGVLWHSRPGAALLFSVVFGAVGPHSWGLFAVQSLLNGGVVVALFVLARPYVGLWRAAALAALWVILPNHTSLFLWASTMCAVVACMLLIVGAILLRDDRFGWAVAAMVVAGLTYEMVVPVAALVVAVVCVSRREWRRLAVGWGALLAVTAWVIYFTPKTIMGRAAHEVYVIQSQWGWGVWNFPHAEQIVPTLLTAAVGLAVWRAVHDRRDIAARIVLAGLVVTGAALVTVVRVRSNYAGLDDRFVSLAAIGTAAVYVGAGDMLRRVSRPALAVVVGLLLASSWQIVGEQLDAHRWADASIRAAATTGATVEQVKWDRGVPGAGSGWEDSARVLLATGR